MSDLQKYTGPEPDEVIVESVVVDEHNNPINNDEYESLDKYATSTRFKVKPVRLFILVLLILGMMKGTLPLWFGGGLIAVYFGVKLVIRHYFQKLLIMPFVMKGKALAGAIAEVHGYEWTETPEGDSDEDEEGPALRYAWVDVTIIPPELTPETQGFTHWEPGEMMLCPEWYKIKKVSDLDVCLPVEDVKFVEGEGIISGDEKCMGMQRIKLLIGIPEGQYAFRFVYYLEVFGELNLAD